MSIVFVILINGTTALAAPPDAPEYLYRSFDSNKTVVIFPMEVERAYLSFHNSGEFIAELKVVDMKDGDMIIIPPNEKQVNYDTVIVIEAELYDYIYDYQTGERVDPPIGFPGNDPLTTVVMTSIVTAAVVITL